VIAALERVAFLREAHLGRSVNGLGKIDCCDERQHRVPSDHEAAGRPPRRYPLTAGKPDRPDPPAFARASWPMRATPGKSDLPDPPDLRDPPDLADLTLG